MIARAAQTAGALGTMQAYVALVLAFAAAAHALPRDRLGYEREIDATSYNQVPKHHDYILNEEYLALQKNRAKLITKLRVDEATAADNVILESNVVRIVRPVRRREEAEATVPSGLVRRRRGYNLEHVQVPARHPYLAVPGYFSRFRRWG